jgi:anti-anti-sigma regulatory factor
MTIKITYEVTMLRQYNNIITTLVLNSNRTNENLEELNIYINKNDCSYMSVDISGLNILDASTVATLGSTMHYIKYPEGKINWIVNSSKVKDIILLVRKALR